MTAAPAPRRPLERVALTLLADRPAPGEAAVIALASVVDADDVGGRAVELSRLLALHSGSPTLLMEANLRAPSRLAAAMEMEAGPGVIDALRAPERAEEAVRPTPDPRLWVMTAGGTAPSHAPVGLADFAEVIATVRHGRWAAPRRVLDIRDGDLDPTPVEEPGPALVGVGAERGRHDRPGRPAGPGDGPDLRPFNEGPATDLGPLPPLPVPTLRAATPGATRPRLSSVVVIAPPIDERSDGDVVTSQCDRTILLVHAGVASREQVGDAVARIGAGRLLGTVVVMPPGRRRR